MGVILALLAMEVALGIAPVALVIALSGRWTAAVLWHEALHAGPRLDQRAVDREVIAGQQRAQQAETPKPRLSLRLRAPCLYPDPAYSPKLHWTF